MDTMGMGALIANNVMVQSDYGIIAKHCNNVQFLQSVWGMTQAQLTNPTRIWHNTVYQSMGAHIELAINLTGTQPDYLCLTNAQHNIFAGKAYISLYDAPAAREATPSVFTDYNIHPLDTTLGQSLYRTGFSPSTWTTFNLAQLRANSATLNWEQHGQQLDPTFVDAANNDLTPTVDYRASVSLPSQWGDQIGARGVTPGPLKWRPEPVIAISGSAGSQTNLKKIVDGYGAITNYVIATNVELNHVQPWIVADFGSQKTFSSFRWTPWALYTWDNVKDYQIDVANSPTGPWTTVLTDTFQDHGSTSFNIDLPQAQTARCVRFMALTNWLNGANRPDLVGGGNDRLVFSEFEVGAVVAIGSGTGTPVNTVPPGISGTLVQNNTLTVVPGSWNGALQRTYRWLRDGTTAVGTGTTYLLVAGDVGHQMAVEETAIGSGGATAVATSALTASITAPPSAPTNTVAPSISGTLTSGNLLTGNVGAWTGSPTFTYRWLLDGTTSVGTAATYLLGGTDVGHSLTFEVTATNAAGFLTVSSAASALVGSGVVLPGAAGSYWGIPA